MDIRMLEFHGAPMKPITLSLNSKILEAAREMQIDISETVNELLAVELTRRYWERWMLESKPAIDAYNERITREGLPLSKYRNF